MYFDHEKLIVYQKSLEFIDFTEPILQRFKYRIPVVEHLDEASTSISLNIAEGTGKFTPKDKSVTQGHKDTKAQRNERRRRNGLPSLIFPSNSAAEYNITIHYNL